ncbi:MAG: DUF664 domain-containing protein [Actinobacteria bacterium]|nr:DUF664 domain-containing protein [Actinomycetota bacterium]
MDVAAVYLELYGRIPPLVEETLDGLDPDALTARVTPDANPIGWLVWHLTRVQDHHVSELLGADQIYLDGSGRPERFGSPADAHDIGYGHSSADVARVRPESVDALLDYHAAVDARTRTYLAGLTADALDEIVDRRWDPPVTLGVRLVSIADDSLQHCGQAAYVRGLLGR